jgi:Ran GTPase-activating protein (RanGAP) involved in mRNA processing and transport
LWLLLLGRLQSITLEKLSLDGNCSVGDEGAIALAAALSLRHSNIPLKELGPAGCGIESEGAAALGRALPQNQTLEIMRLDMNGRNRNEGAIAVVDGLSVNKSLKELNFGNCGVGNAGVAALGRTLKTNSQLKDLDLSSDDGIGNEGIIAVAQGLTDNDSLVRLNLGHCGLGHAEAPSLGRALRTNSKLEELWLYGNGQTGDEGVIALADGVCVLTKVSRCLTLEIVELVMRE